VVPAIWEAEVGGSWFKASLGKVEARPYLKNKVKNSKRTVGMAQVIECLCSKHQALSSVPSTTKNEKEAKKEEKEEVKQIIGVCSNWG
jgi:hypothetical protein